MVTRRLADPRTTCVLALAWGTVGWLLGWYGYVIFVTSLVILVWGGTLWKLKRRAPLTLNLIVGLLFAGTLASGLFLLGRVREVEHTMTWEMDGATEAFTSHCGPAGVPIVKLKFREFPGHYVTLHSADLAKHLQAGGKENVSVQFRGDLRFFPESKRASQSSGRQSRNLGRVRHSCVHGMRRRCWPQQGLPGRQPITLRLAQLMGPELDRGLL